MIRLLRAQLDRIPDELHRDLPDVPGVVLSRAHLWRVLKRLGLPLKKSLHAVERDTGTNRIRREQYPERIRGTDPEELIFLDET